MKTTFKAVLQSTFSTSTYCRALWTIGHPNPRLRFSVRVCLSVTKRPHLMVLARIMVLARVMVVARVMVLARVSLCFGLSYIIS